MIHLKNKYINIFLTAALCLLFSSCNAIAEIPDLELPSSETVSQTTAPSFSETEPTLSSKTTSETDSAEPDETQSSVPAIFSEEFETKLNELSESYEINLNCANVSEDMPEGSCGCKPIPDETENEAEEEDNGDYPESYEKVLSIGYYDIETGLSYFYNPYPMYPVASVIKLPFCTYIYRLAEAGKFDLDDKMTYEERHYFHGTGVVKDSDFGTEFTIRELLKLAIVKSDNAAFQMLKDLCDYSDFEEFLLQNGVIHSECRRQYGTKICAQDAIAYGKIVYDYISEDSESAQEFKDNLMNTVNRMITSSYPFYRKYGWTDYAFHDIAVIEADKPYILAICSNLDEGKPADYALFDKISKLVEEYSQKEVSYEEYQRFIQDNE